MFAGLTGTTEEMGFTFRDDRDINMLDFSKIKNASHLFQKTLGYYGNKFKADGFTKYLSRAELENIESLYEDSGIAAIADTSFMSKAKNIANVFKNARYLESADLSTWTISDMEDASSIFEGSMLKTIDLSNSTFENTENTQNMFKNSAATTINLGKATFNNVENASGMFENARASTISMPEATFAKTTDFSNMFKGATSASSIDLSKITFSAATNLSGMFQDTSAEQLVLNNTNLAGNNITDMSFMFKNSKVKNIDLGSMQTGPLTSIVGMFKNTNNLETITLPSVFNTSNITDMSSLFENNIKLKTINNLANLDTTNVRNMSRMFASDFWLPMQNIIPNLRANKVEDTSYMFYGTRATSPVVFPVTFNTENLTDMSYMFVGFSVPSLDISNFKLGNVTTMEGTFSAESKTTAVGPITWPSGQINMPRLTTMRALFKFNTAQNQIVLPTLKTPALTDTSYMFYGIGKIDKIDNINSLDTANVTTMEGMFAYNDTSLMKGENVKFGFNTSKVKNMNLMFKNSYVNYLDLSSFDTRSLVTAVSTFDYTWIKILDLTNWDTRNLEDVTSMFSGSTWLVTIYASESFVTTKVTASNDIFYSVTYDLGSGAIGNNITYARIGAPGAPGAFTKKS
jgi:lipoprotein